MSQSLVYRCDICSNTSEYKPVNWAEVTYSFPKDGTPQLYIYHACKSECVKELFERIIMWGSEHPGSTFSFSARTSFLVTLNLFNYQLKTPASKGIRVDDILAKVRITPKKEGIRTNLFSITGAIDYNNKWPIPAKVKYALYKLNSFSSTGEIANFILGLDDSIPVNRLKQGMSVLWASPSYKEHFITYNPHSQLHGRLYGLTSWVDHTGVPIQMFIN